MVRVISKTLDQKKPLEFKACPSGYIIKRAVAVAKNPCLPGNHSNDLVISNMFSNKSAIKVPQPLDIAT